MRGPPTWAVYCFRGVAEIRLAYNSVLKGETWHYWKSLIKPSTMMFGLITYALNSILSVLIT